MTSVVLMVAEKPSMAESIAKLLSDNTCSRRARGLPVYEYPGVFNGRRVTFRVTSTTGHVFNTDFAPQFQNWDKTDERELFSAETVRKEASGARVVQHLQAESADCSAVVLWLDCDREGENICFEVLSIVKRHISWDNTWRAKFSAVTKQEMRHAMENLVKPNQNISDAVECRQELDLKVGCAFTRYQTKYFQGKYGDLDATVVSYGPCQTPTLGFCVQRHDESSTSSRRTSGASCPSVHRAGGNISLTWERGRVFDEPMARLMFQRVAATKASRVTQVSRTLETKPRPAALNTVELLKVASRLLNMGRHVTMSVAEQLYMGGYISYPRTESTAYPASFDLDAVLHELTSAPTLGVYARHILSGARTRPKSGVDACDHPPITPMRSAGPGELYGDSWKVYEYIARHFLASLSPDCRYHKTKVVVDLNGELFSTVGKQLEAAGWTEILLFGAMRDDAKVLNMSALATSCSAPTCDCSRGRRRRPTT